MSTDLKPTKFFWDGKEVSELEYKSRKFCPCGALNAPGKRLCHRCLKSWNALRTERGTHER